MGERIIYIAQVYHILFIHPSADRYLGCFQLLEMEQVFMAPRCPSPFAVTDALRDQMRERGVTTNKQAFCALYPEEGCGKKEGRNGL